MKQYLLASFVALLVSTSVSADNVAKGFSEIRPGVSEQLQNLTSPTELQKTIRRLRLRISSLSRQNRQLRQARSALQRKNLELLNRVNFFKNRANALSRRVTSLREQNSILNREVERLRATSTQQTINNLTGTNRALRRALTGQNTVITNLRASGRRCSALLSRCRDNR
jgi:chromosome segregation ATPase